MKRKYIILIGFLLVYILLGFTLYRFPKSTDIQTSSPVWRGIVPGSTTEEEVFAFLGEPYTINRTLFSVMFEYESHTVSLGARAGSHTFYDQVYFQHGRVDYIIDDLFEQEENLTPNTLFRLYGIPEKVTFTTPALGNHAILYCEQGFIATEGGNTILYKIYFEPQSTQSCMKKFRFALPGRWKGAEDVFADEDPWGFDEEE